MLFLLKAKRKQISYEVIEGKPFGVIPVIGGIEGIFNEIYLPADVLTQSIPDWKDVPIHYTHPTDELGAIPMGDSDITPIGFFSTFEDETKNIAGNVYIDLEALISSASDDANTFMMGQMALDENSEVEVSIAFQGVVESRVGEFEGVVYEQVVTEMTPDHLAILINEPAACSWQDGCGLRTHVQEGNPMSDIRTLLIQKLNLGDDCECTDDELIEQYDQFLAQQAADETQEDDAEQEQEDVTEEDVADDEVTVPENVQQLSQAIDNAGGLDAVMQAISLAQNQEIDLRKRLVGDLKTVKNLAFSAQDLADMPIGDLQKLHTTLVGTEETFFIGGVNMSDDDEWVDYETPTLEVQ